MIIFVSRNYVDSLGSS